MNVSGSKPGGDRTSKRAGVLRNALFSRRTHARLAVALVISLFFHLSMITVFRIVLMVPREQVQFYEVRIVSAPDVEADSTPPGTDAVRARDALALSGTDFYTALPDVELPVLEFAELERLRIRHDALEPLSNARGAFEDYVPSDSWARFGGELQRFGRSLRDLALPDRDAPPVLVEEEDRRVLRHRPAEGFEAYIEWDGPPRDRELLFSPPIKALWQLPPGQLARPLEIVFKVDASGRVINVWSPILEDSAWMEEVQMAVLQYRFGPLSASGAEETGAAAVKEPGEQSGLLFIRRAEGGP